MSHTWLTQSALALVIASLSSVAAAQDTAPDPRDWADLLADADSDTRPSARSVQVNDHRTNNSNRAVNELERVEREVRLLLRPIVDDMRSRDDEVERALENAAATIDYFLNKYRGQIATSTTAVAAEVAKGDGATDRPHDNPNAVKLQTLTPIVTASSSLGPGQDVLSAAAAELRRIAAELESVVTTTEESGIHHDR